MNWEDRKRLLVSKFGFVTVNWRSRPEFDRTTRWAWD
jgi:hypothetical protein